MRTNNSIKNSITQLITNIITIIFLFIGQTLFIKILGIEYTGLNGLFTNILTVLNLFELGIGSSITYNLYKYVKNKDKETIKSIMYFYKKTYKYITLLILIIGLLITPFIKYIVKDITVNINIYLVYILFLLSTVSTYILSYKRNLIIANQNNYIINIIEIIYIIILNIIQILILYITKNYYLYLIIKIICILLGNIIINIKANKLYPFLLEKNIKPLNTNIKESIINRVKALIIHKTSAAVTNGTDNILISAFLGITTAGLYTSYEYIIKSVKKLFGNIIQTTMPSIGNLLIEKNKEKNYQTFKKIRFLNYWITVFTATSILLLTEPFIKIWLGKEYLLPTSVLIVLIINYFQTMMRPSYSTFKDAGGIWIEDKFIPLLQISINLISSIILVKLIGLPGVFIGTILSSLVLWCYSYPKYVYINLFDRKLKNYIKETLTHILIFIFITSLSLVLNKYSNNIMISIIISITIPNIILLLIYGRSEEFKYYKNLIKKILIKTK